MTVDLNCDMGESFGAYKIGNDSEVIQYVTSSNIACGAHASDPAVMKRTVGLCVENNVMIGAHPGYPDLQGFGRRFLDMDHGEIVDSVLYQLGALKGFIDYFGAALQHVKLHGALYHYALKEEKLFLDIMDHVRTAFGDIIFLTLGTPVSGELKNRCRASGMRIALEAFPDRAYGDDGKLLSRTLPGAVIDDAEIIARRAVSMVAKSGVESINGRWIDMSIDTICIHGDNPESVKAAGKIREYAARDNIVIEPLGRIV